MSWVLSRLKASWSAARRSSATLNPSAKTDSPPRDRKSTRLNSSHSQISYAVFCLKKKIILSKTLALGRTGQFVLVADDEPRRRKFHDSGSLGSGYALERRRNDTSAE